MVLILAMSHFCHRPVHLNRYAMKNWYLFVFGAICVRCLIHISCVLCAIIYIKYFTIIVLCIRHSLFHSFSFCVSSCVFVSLSLSSAYFVCVLYFPSGFTSHPPMPCHPHSCSIIMCHAKLLHRISHPKISNKHLCCRQHRPAPIHCKRPAAISPTAITHS